MSLLSTMYTPEVVDYSKGREEVEAQLKKNQQKLDYLDAIARKNNTFVGRTVSVPVADGYATYVVVKENKTSCRIEVATGLGDDYCSYEWGREATVSKSFLTQHFRAHEALEKLLGRC